MDKNGTKVEIAAKQKVDRDEGEEGKGEEEYPLSLSRQLLGKAVFDKHRMPSLIDHVVRHCLHASSRKEHEVCVVDQIDPAVTRHFSKDTFRSIPLHGIAKASTNHDSNSIMWKCVRPMKHLKKLRSNPGPFIEHFFKI